ncbi:MAG: RIP metalloprotease RseP [Dehalococcoidia bacterium]|nr:RIP metalloprotease RseP [Dehalococcoidia bacterium]
MDILIAIILFIVALFFIISLHELGHFITAKRLGVEIEEFGFGFPPRLFSIKRGETVYSLNAIPIGAFVRSVGEDDPTVPRSLASKGPWSRLAIYAAGPLVNVFLAFILLSTFFALPITVIASNGVMVHSVMENSAAEEAGIEAGDVILEIDGVPIHKWGDMQNIINSSKEEQELTFRLQKSDSSTYQAKLEPQYNAELGRRLIGVLLGWNIVNKVLENSPADKADIIPGDTILGINGQAVYSKEGMSDILNAVEKGQEIQVTLLRGEETVTASMVKEFDFAQQSMGAELLWVNGTHMEKERITVGKAIHAGASYVIHMPAMLIASIPLIRETPDKALVGPIGAGQLTVEAVRAFGFSNLIFMAGIISLGIALFNFFPFPPLDGGGMLVAFIEGIKRGKRLSRHAVRLAQTIGTAILVALMIAITLNDILRLIGGGGFGL